EAGFLLAVAAMALVEPVDQVELPALLGAGDRVVARVGDRVRRIGRTGPPVGRRDEARAPERGVLAARADRHEAREVLKLDDQGVERPGSAGWGERRSARPWTSGGRRWGC